MFHEVLTFIILTIKELKLISLDLSESAKFAVLSMKFNTSNRTEEVQVQKSQFCYRNSLEKAFFYFLSR